MFNSMQQMAQSTCVCEVDATELLALRAELVADQDMLGCKITVNDLLCKMLGKVLPRHLWQTPPLTAKPSIRTSTCISPWRWAQRMA